MANLQVKPGDTPPAPEVLAQAIVDIGKAMAQFDASRLNRRALVLLIHDATGVTKGNIALVLDGLRQLESTYLKPRSKPAAVPAGVTTSRRRSAT